MTTLTAHELETLATELLAKSSYEDITADVMIGKFEEALFALEAMERLNPSLRTLNKILRVVARIERRDAALAAGATFAEATRIGIERDRNVDLLGNRIENGV